jgi:RNA polymerase sigma-70 factor (ECF subfamily)
MSRPADEPSDRELVSEFQAGREEAFVILMQRHERKVFNLAYRMLGRMEDAREATQDAFLSCFRHLGSFRGDSAFSTWLHRVAVNACYDALRKRPPPTGPIDERVDAEGRHADPADQAAAAADVQRALLAIPVEFRAVLVLHELQDLPVEEVAAALDLPVGTVKSRLHRGRVALGQALSLEPDPAESSSNPPNP